MSTCPTDDALSQYVERTLSPADAERVQEHLAGCGACSGVVGLLLAGASPPTAKANGFDERYELRQRLGVGAMGEVFAAYDRKLARVVALKWLKRGVADEARGRALGEAQALAKLAHPNVVHVYDVVELDGDDVIAMEFIEGKNLRGWLDEGHPPAQVLERFGECAAGLAAAHDAGLVHRDFKPENVLVGKDAVARVVDFGLSKELRPAGPTDDATLTGLDTVTSAGTPRYMAPELFQGRAADAKSDQFAWGVALYEAVCRESPFTVAGLDARLREMRERRFEARDGFRRQPGSVKAVLRRALAPDAADRYPSMRDAARALRPRATSSVWLALGAGAALAAVGGWLAWQHTHQCDGAAQALERTWSDDVRARLAARLRALDVPYRDRLAVEATGLLGAWAERWRSTSVAACEATRLRHELPAAVEAARSVCLERARLALDATLTALGDVRSNEATTVLETVARLPDPQACGGALSLLELEPRPAKPGLASKLSDAEAEVAAVRAAADLGRYAGLVDRCVRLRERVAELGWRPLSAAAGLQCGRVTLLQGQVAAAGTELRAAMEAALASNSLSTALESATQLINAEVALGRGVDVATAWLVVGRAAAGRAGLLETPSYADLLHTMSLAQDRAKDMAASAGLHSQALDVLRRAGLSATPMALELQAELGAVLAALGRGAEAERQCTAALDALTQQFGVHFPPTIRALSSRTIVLARVGKWAESLSAAERELEVVREHYGVGHWRVAISHANASEAANMAGRPDVAFKHARTAHDVLFGTQDTRGTTHLVVDVVLAEAAWGAGAYGQACDTASAVLRDAARMELPDEYVARAEWLQRRCEDRGRPDAAALARAAVALAPRLGGDAFWARREVQAVIGAAPKSK